MTKEEKAQRICAKLQRKLILKGKWRDKDRQRWDKIISVILREREKRSR